MDKQYLHAVVIQKPMPLALARLKAQRFIRKSRKTYFTETETDYRFRNLPKTYFADFEVKPIDEEITLVVGHLLKKYTDEAEDAV